MTAAQQAPLRQTYKAVSGVASGATIAIPAGIGLLNVKASLLATLTVLLPPSPFDRQFCRIAVPGGVTLLTVQDGSGAAVANGTAITGIGTYGSTLWHFEGTAWQRVG